MLESSFVPVLLRVVLENWTGGRGNSGKSFNIYDANTKKWEPYWVDSNGGRIFFSGHLNGTTMDYFADTDEDGKKATRHLQFFNVGPDQVRRFSQRSEDGGKTWAVEYDFTYFWKKAVDWGRKKNEEQLVGKAG
jgi:hypothetical protein